MDLNYNFILSNEQSIYFLVKSVGFTIFAFL